MIRQEFSVESYWKVIVYYNLDYGLFNIVSHTLLEAGADKDTIEDIYHHMSSYKAKAVTYSNYSRHISVVLFNRHNSMADFINSIVHEAEHIKQAMLYAYKINDAGEPPAYTIGFLASRMYEVLRYLLCDCKPS